MEQESAKTSADSFAQPFASCLKSLVLVAGRPYGRQNGQGCALLEGQCFRSEVEVGRAPVSRQIGGTCRRNNFRLRKRFQVGGHSQRAAGEPSILEGPANVDASKKSQAQSMCMRALQPSFLLACPSQGLLSPQQQAAWS